ncbi:hypothetical protein JI435_411890 [Parastagonospora nodorum SN15]|uniref:Uncharacterized protein n=1 Tax=Phaeosphaeria nodorum (strain SN15 / ATCC MYA-4574 / FGSC 10173) TaxID=321614 RepID=A0A7U2I3B9_PHANO|nr:hypothetical protein JI435_411890 [Parastagonospora nodorum SN15]
MRMRFYLAHSEVVPPSRLQFQGCSINLSGTLWM